MEACNGHIYNCLAKLKYEWKHAVAVSRAHAKNCPRIQSNQMYCFKTENLISKFPLHLFARNDFFMSQQFNEQIGRLLESGLIQKWTKDMETKHLKANESDDRIVLTLSHFVTAGFIFIVGTPIFCLTFICELIVFHRIKTGKAGAFVKWFERIFFIPRRSF